MASHFDPRIGADRSVAYSSVTHRVSMRGLTSTRPRTLQGGKSTLQAWAKRIDEDAKILALKSTMLETLFGEAGVLTDRSVSTYADLHASIIRFLDDKLPVSMVETSSSSTTNVVQNLAENTQESEEEI